MGCRVENRIFLSYFSTKIQRHHPGHLAKSATTGLKSDKPMRNGLSGQDEGEGEGHEEVHVYAERGAEVAIHREVVENSKV